MDPFTMGAGVLTGVLGGIFGSEEPPEWKNVEFQKNLGLNTDLGYYDYDPDRQFMAGYQGALGAGKMGFDYLQKSKLDALNQRRRMAAEMIPGMASFRATPASMGMGGATGGLLANVNFQKAQRAGQEWADAGLNTQAYDLAAASMGLQGYQTGLGYMGLEAQRGQYAYGQRAQADAANKQYGADMYNRQLEFNTMGKYGQQNAAWQSRQAKWNSLMGMGGTMMGYGMTAPDSGLLSGLFNPYKPEVKDVPALAQAPKSPLGPIGLPVGRAPAAWDKPNPLNV